MPVVFLRTGRLLLRQFRDDDLDALCRLNADPEVRHYILDGSTLDRSETVARFAAMVAHWTERGFGASDGEVGLRIQSHRQGAGLRTTGECVAGNRVMPILLIS